MLDGRFDQHFLEIFAKAQDTRKPEVPRPNQAAPIDDLTRWLRRFTWPKRN